LDDPAPILLVHKPPAEGHVPRVIPDPSWLVCCCVLLALRFFLRVSLEQRRTSMRSLCPHRSNLFPCNPPTRGGDRKTYREFNHLPLQLGVALPTLGRVILRARAVRLVQVRIRVLDASLSTHHLVRQALLPLRGRLRPERVVDHFGRRGGAGELAWLGQLGWIELCYMYGEWLSDISPRKEEDLCVEEDDGEDGGILEKE